MNCLQRYEHAEKPLGTGSTLGLTDGAPLPLLCLLLEPKRERLPYGNCGLWWWSQSAMGTLHEGTNEVSALTSVSSLSRSSCWCFLNETQLEAPGQGNHGDPFVWVDLLAQWRTAENWLGRRMKDVPYVFAFFHIELDLVYLTKSEKSVYVLG